MEKAGSTRNKKIAITGGIGSGKSALAEIVRRKGYPVYSCDAIYREIFPQETFQEKLKAAFGDCVKDGSIDRAALSRKVFSDEGARKKLNALSHPAIMETLFDRMSGDRLAFAEVPLLFEEGLENAFDGVIAVRRNRERRIEAVMRRDGLTEDEVTSRVRSQFDYDGLEGKDCFILENDGSFADLERKADEALSWLNSKFSDGERI